MPASIKSETFEWIEEREMLLNQIINMQTTIKFAACILLIGFVLFPSCKKKDLIVSPPSNKAPIANAGIDQNISYQPDSIKLDGSASTDPDGTIVSYQWVRIAGPLSINIVDSAAKSTKVKSSIKGRIEVGIYVFELKVTDNSGASAVARVTVTVNRKTINVSNVNQLYDAVNDTANAGALIVFASGTYALVSTRPNGGRLELQEGMDLQGQQGQSDLVIIDESALPSASFTIPPSFKTGGIRMGRGSNAIQWLTVKGNPSTNALSAIDTDLSWPSVIHILIAHVIAKQSQNGIDIRNPGFAGVNRVIEAEINDNEFVENNVGAGQGMEIQNANGATGSIIRANMKGNYVHGNKLGFRCFNTATSSASITIKSIADRFEDNGMGCSFNAGASTSATSTANGNLIKFDAYNASFRNNHGPSPDGTPVAGIYAGGGLSVVAANSASNNRLEINLWGCLFLNNTGSDMSAFGAYSYTPSLAGTNNVVEIHLYNESRNATVLTTTSLPAEPAGTNIVNIYR